MIGESINFMITGMTIVFLFLVIMVLLLEAQGRIVNNFISQDSTVDTDLKKNDKPKPKNTGSIKEGNLIIKPIPIITIPTISKNFAI